jgi:hypothetical protein
MGALSPRRRAGKKQSLFQARKPNTTGYLTQREKLFGSEAYSEALDTTKAST